MSDKELAWKFGSIAGRIHDQTVKPVTYKQDPSEVIEQYLKENGLAIVPASAVPTPEQRAAVEKVTQAFTMSQMYMRYVKTTDPQVFDANVAIALRERFDEIRDSITEGDIEAARAVAEGGK